MYERTHPRNTLIALTLLFAASSASPQTTVDNGLVHIRSSTDRGNVRVLLENLPPTNDLRAVSIARGTWRRADRIVGPVAGSVFQSTAYHVGSFFVSNDTREVIAHFRARAADASPVAIRVVDPDGRVRCQGEGSGAAGASCMARAPFGDFFGRLPGGQLQLSVQAEQRGTRSTSVTVEGFFDEGYSAASELELAVDPNVRADGTAVMDLPINVRTYAPGKALAQLIEIRDGETPIRRFMSSTEWEGIAPAASLALFSGNTPGIARASTSHAGVSTHRRLSFLVPANVDTVDITATTYESPEGAAHPRGTPQDLVLELHHLDAGADVARVDAVPAGRTPDVVVDAEAWRASPDSVTERVTLRGASLRPGRWFAVPVSKTGIPLNVHLDVRFPAGRALAPVHGHYFNPARAGHGFYLAEAGSEWVLIWYTFDGNGVPVWYYAQAPRPNEFSGGAQWYATLYRNVWTGTRTRFQFVGFVQLAMTGEGRLAFAHLVNGVLGTETMQRLGAAGCSQRRAGHPVDVNGLWYSPEKSGYGFSAEVIGDTEFFLAYAYDGLGRPTWATAQQRFDEATRVPLLQARGFCPTCSVAPLVRAEIGGLDRRMVDAAAPDGLPGYGTLGIDARWGDGLAGGWREHRAAALLSARTGCQ